MKYKYNKENKMKISEFEEKEYEGPLYNQLEKTTNILWQPGQVFEKVIGVDRCIYIEDDDIWSSLGFRSIPMGVRLSRRRWHYIWWNQRKGKILPSFKLNLFIQAKRCYKGTVPVKVKNYKFGRYCCKFDIVPHQQNALEQVALNLKNRAMVVYAAPMFSKQKELYQHTVKSTIIQNSTFPDVDKLSGHSSWYYNHKVNGIANVKPTPIEVEDILKRISEFSRVLPQEYKENSIHDLISLADKIYGVLEMEELMGDSRIAFLFNKRDELRNYLRYDEDLFEEEDYEAIVSYYEIILFTLVFNLEWFVVGNLK